MRKLYKTFLILILMALLLTSCIACRRQGLPSTQDIIPFTPPEKTNIAGSYNAKLFYIMKETGELSYENHEIDVYNDRILLETIIERLMEAPKYNYHKNPINKSYTLSRLEVSEGVANIFFTGEKFNPSSLSAIQQYLETQAVILASLEDFGVNTVNLYINGVASSYKECPLDYATKHETDLSEYIDEKIKHYNSYQLLNEDSPYTANCTMYVPNSSGLFLATKQRIVIKTEASNEELVKVVSERFISLYEGILPNDFEVVEYEFNKYMGKSNVSIKVGGSIDRNELQIIKTGLCLTLTGFIPQLQYVTIMYGIDIAVEQRTDCNENIGNTAMVYYPYLMNDVLSAKHITMNKGLICCYLKDYISEYFESSVENGCIFRGLDTDYILDIFVSEGVAVLNLSEEFYDVFSQYINNEYTIVDGDVSERLIIFGIVNTLTEIPYIDSVLFLCEGDNVGVIKNMYLGSPLYKNIGLVYGS